MITANDDDDNDDNDNDDDDNVDDDVPCTLSSFV